MKYKILLLLVIALVSVSASFAMLETNNDTSNDVNAIDEVNKTYSNKEIGDIKQQQCSWYDRNYDKIGVDNYLKDHKYVDGAKIDLPEDPFPYKDTDFRIILFSAKSESHGSPGLYFESLSTYLDPIYQKALDNGTVMSYMALVKRVAGSNNIDTPDNLDDATIDNLSKNNNNDAIKDNHTASAGMEATGLPIAALILAALVSIVAYRRKD